MVRLTDNEIPTPQQLGYSVNHATWGRQFDPDNEDDATDKGTINGYIHFKIESYRGEFKNYSGIEIWQYFHEDFEGFTLEIFKRASRTVVRKLR